jgi:gluconolactonase
MSREHGSRGWSRRELLAAATSAAVAGTAASLRAQTAGAPVAPPTTVSTPPRDFRPGSSPSTLFNDPDIVIVDPAFAAYVQPNAGIRRLWTGGNWLEGPAWSGMGRYLVFSEIPTDRQYRWIEDDERVSVFRAPSNNSNGNAFDSEGRQITCEHLTRRVVRYEHDGSVTVLADSYNGGHLTSPNDVVAHPDGSYWFTDPPYGATLYEGQADAAGGPTNAAGHLRPRVGQPAEAGQFKRNLPNAVYRVDPGGRVEQVLTEQQVPDPNGLAFSPDYKRLYVVSTSKGPGDTGPGGHGDAFVFDVDAGHRLSNQRRFSDFTINGVKCPPDGVKCDVDGNVWCSSNAGSAVGYSGVTIWAPDGHLLGRIRLPENCANLCFGGPKRNRLFMVAGQSLYAVYVNTQGA